MKKPTKTPSKKVAPKKTEPKAKVIKKAEAIDTPSAPYHAEEILAREQNNPDFNKEIEMLDVASSPTGHAIVSVDVPAHTREVAIAHSLIPGCAVAAVEAWDAIKASDDAPFAACAPQHREKLMAHAEAVFTSGQVASGDTALAKFERKVAEIKKAQEDAAKAAQGE